MLPRSTPPAVTVLIEMPRGGTSGGAGWAAARPVLPE